MKHLTLTLAVAGLMCSTAMAGTVVINDSFTDGGRNNGADAMDANWWTTTNSSAIEVSKGSLGLVSGGSGRGIRTTFAPQALSPGKSIKATFTFTTPKTIGTKRDSAFRIGMYDKAGRAALDSDQSASSKKPNANYNNLPGYMIDFDVGLAKSNIMVRKHGGKAPTGRLLGTTKGYQDLKAGGNPYTFAPGQTYTGTMTVMQAPNGVQVSGSLSQGGKVLSQFSHLDAGAKINRIGMLAFHVNSKTFGSSKKKNTPDNGIDFKNVKVEMLP
ncbi:hypothetical protein EOL70_16390 [Leucothrix sargassi]|nr:hypothetical protein EOL70_16390 [Leucothrix sargassi]